MPAAQPLTDTARRRRWRIARLAAAMCAAALVLAWLESRPAVIVYNETPEPIDRIVLRIGETVWAVDALDAGESRRWHPPVEARGEVSVIATGWAEGRSVIQAFDPRRSRSLIVRLGSFQTVTTSTEVSWWGKLVEW